MNFVYSATVLSVHDGDTFTALVDLGFYVHIEVKVRVRGLYCAELAQPDGQDARVVADRLLEGTLTVQSYKDQQSFARWICDVWLEDGRSFADVMNDAGYGGKGTGS